MLFYMFRECVLLMMFSLTLVMMIVMMMMTMMMVMMTPVIIGAAPRRQLKLSHISETKPTPAHHGMDDHDHGMVMRRIMIMIMNMAIDHASMHCNGDHDVEDEVRKGEEGIYWIFWN